MNMPSNIPTAIAQLLNRPEDADTLFTQLMPAIGEWLQCDRCFLYLRDPATSLGRVPFVWVRSSEVPSIYDADWKPEPESLVNEDPMFAAALRTAPSIYVEDVEAASPDILNRQFEQENFGHRALVHAHLCYEGQLWGVLQPCVFGRPRPWQPEEQQAIEQIVAAITPIAVAYIQAANTAQFVGIGHEQLLSLVKR